MDLARQGQRICHQRHLLAGQGSHPVPLDCLAIVLTILQESILLHCLGISLLTLAALIAENTIAESWLRQKILIDLLFGILVCGGWMQRISLTSLLLLCLDGACFAEGRDPLLAHREVGVERVA